MKLYQVDAFTSQMFKGNPAGVCVLSKAHELDDDAMQNIASEMNLSETAFVYKNGSEYSLRWFTPANEVDFCGHATLSSAHILWEYGLERANETVVFNSNSGKLYARKTGDGIEMDFPLKEVIETVPDRGIVAALGVAPLYVASDKTRYLFEVGSRDELINVNPNYALLAEFGRMAFMVTCRSDDGMYDFYSRFFAPGVGVNEDPVTGSAHCYLAPYWGKKLGKTVMKGAQLSKRGGEMECELTGTDRVLLRGSAVTVFELRMIGR